MILLFISILFAILQIISLTTARRRWRIIERLRETTYGLEEELDRLKIKNRSLESFNEALSQLSKDFVEAQEAPATYHVRSLDAGYFAVIRLCQVRGRDYYIMIKRFTDPDTAYNLSEAEDLCDKLNEK